LPLMLGGFFVFSTQFSFVLAPRCCRGLRCASRGNRRVWPHR